MWIGHTHLKFREFIIWLKLTAHLCLWFGSSTQCPVTHVLPFLHSTPILSHWRPLQPDEQWHLYLKVIIVKVANFGAFLKRTLSNYGSTRICLHSCTDYHHACTHQRVVSCVIQCVTRQCLVWYHSQCTLRLRLKFVERKNSYSKDTDWKVDRSVICTLNTRVKSSCLLCSESIDRCANDWVGAEILCCGTARRNTLCYVNIIYDQRSFVLDTFDLEFGYVRSIFCNIHWLPQSYSIHS